MHEGVYQQNEQHQQQSQAHNQQTEAVGANLKGCGRWLAGNAVGNGTDGGASAGFDHPHPCAATDDGRTHEHGVGGILQIGCRGGQCARMFFDRIGFTG